MKIRHIVSITFGAITLLIVYLAIHLGVFKSVEFSEELAPATSLLAMDHVGAYHKIVPLIQEVENWVRSEGGQACKKSFGLFIDDPKMVEQDRLRSQVGCVLEGALTATIPASMKLVSLPERKVIRAKFSGSPAIGPYKVYMKLHELLEEKGLKLSDSTLEIYEVINDKEMNTEYHFPVAPKF